LKTGEKIMEIKGILVTLLAPMNDHIANGGEKILGNASSIKQRPDGRVYISGQKQRHALFSAMERLNFEDNQRNGTYVSNGDGVTTVIEKDLRADLGGFLQTKKESYSGRRTAPLTATPAVALEPSEVGRDLLIRLKVNENKDTRDQALATREYSQDDLMLMNFFIDVGAVSIRKDFTYEGEMHLATRYVKHVSEEERKRRIRLALEATNSLTDYANNARNATTGEPQKVLIVFDTKLSRKAARFFNAEEAERKNILKELEKRGAIYFYGDDTAADGDSVFDAYEKAINFLNENTLFDPTDGAEPITTEEYEKRPAA
jgi:CRISPR-associated protein Cst2